MLILFAQEMMGLVSTQRRSSYGQPWGDEEICMSSYEVCRHHTLYPGMGQGPNVSPSCQSMRGLRHFYLTNQRPRNSLMKMTEMMKSLLSPVKVAKAAARHEISTSLSRIFESNSSAWQDFSLISKESWRNVANLRTAINCANFRSVVLSERSSGGNPAREGSVKISLVSHGSRWLNVARRFWNLVISCWGGSGERLVMSSWFKWMTRDG